MCCIARETRRRTAAPAAPPPGARATLTPPRRDAASVSSYSKYCLSARPPQRCSEDTVARRPCPAPRPRCAMRARQRRRTLSPAHALQGRTACVSHRRPRDVVKPQRAHRRGTAAACYRLCVAVQRRPLLPCGRAGPSPRPRPRISLATAARVHLPYPPPTRSAPRPNCSAQCCDARAPVAQLQLLLDFRAGSAPPCGWGAARISRAAGAPCHQGGAGRVCRVRRRRRGQEQAVSTGQVPHHEEAGLGHVWKGAGVYGQEVQPARGHQDCSQGPAHIQGGSQEGDCGWDACGHSVHVLLRLCACLCRLETGCA